MSYASDAWLSGDHWGGALHEFVDEATSYNTNADEQNVPKLCVETLLRRNQEGFFRCGKTRDSIRTETGLSIRFSDSSAFPYQPNGLTKMNEAWRGGITPYLSGEGILVHKIYCCRNRVILNDRYKDVVDAARVLQQLERAHGVKGVALSEEQRQVADQHVSEFAQSLQKVADHQQGFAAQKSDLLCCFLTPS
ncbi:hypothetical protein BDW59DRAFT_161426 [Aspergillus cavernicola]|uniref:Uncharacterized protein n=1 Tax=Aspergillus cavernicola TaxID=176166 RepID=A0ABR4IDD2_9EURO